jgi:ABC-type methionine transport system ATPase subunit
LRTWDLHALRERLGIVTQDTRLFSGTIRDNVSLFDPAVSPEEIEQACRKACLDEAIQQMPMGYDTVLADGGSSLSGGQRQRLALARALVRKPSVLILDEATSALDAITERAVQENLRGLRCTRVIVAHRLSTVVDADKIMVLEQGKLVGVGRHGDLLARCPTYRDLVHSQSEAAGSSTLLAAEREQAAPRPARPQTQSTLVSLPTGKSAHVTQVFGAAPLPPGVAGPAPVAPAAIPPGPVAPAASAAAAPRAPTQSYTEPALPAVQQAPAPRTVVGISVETKRNTTAAADDGTRVKWGKPTGGT